MSSTLSSNPQQPLESPAAERNKEPIWNVLQSKVFAVASSHNNKTNGNPTVLPLPLRVLEIATGAGVHTNYFSTHLVQQGTPYIWYPADMEEIHRLSTQLFIQNNPLIRDSVEAPFSLTLNEDGIMEKETIQLLSDFHFDIILNINMIHISPWEATLGLMKVAGEKLRPGGFLVLYGSYKVNGSYVESNR